MQTVNMHEAKTHLSSLVERALAGEEIVIAKAGEPMVRLTPVVEDSRPRTPGRLKGRIKMAPDFDETPEEIVALFEGGE